jgi:chromosomal replication initiation ATPase DnaA
MSNKTIKTVQRTVADHYNMTLNELLGRRRTAMHSQRRHLAIWICTELNAGMRNEIAAAFDRDVRLVDWAVKGVRNRRDTEKHYRVESDEIRARASFATLKEVA